MRSFREGARRWPGPAVVLAAALCAPGAGAGPKDPAAKAACAEAFVKGQELEKAGKLVEAGSALVTCGQDQCPDVLRKDCLDLLQSVQASTPTIVLGARDSAGNDLVDVVVSVDGSSLTSKLDGKPLAVDPGPRALRFEGAGAAVERQVVLRVGEKNRVITVDLVGAAGRAAATSAAATGSATTGPAATGEMPGGTSGRSLPVGAFVVGGLGLAAIGVFAGLGLKGKSDLQGLRDTCGKTQSCSVSEVDAVKAELIAADVSLGVGVLAVGAAVIWLVASGRSEAAPAKGAAFIAPAVVPLRDGAVGGVIGRF